MPHKWIALIFLGLTLSLGTLPARPADDPNLPKLTDDQKQQVAIDVLNNAPDGKLDMLSQCSTFGIYPSVDDITKQFLTDDDLGASVKARLTGHGLNATVNPTAATDCSVNVAINTMKSQDANGTPLYSGYIDVYAQVNGYVVDNGKIETLPIDVSDNSELFIASESGIKDQINSAVQAAMDSLLKEYDKEKAAAN